VSAPSPTAVLLRYLPAMVIWSFLVAGVVAVGSIALPTNSTMAASEPVGPVAWADLRESRASDSETATDYVDPRLNSRHRIIGWATIGPGLPVRGARIRVVDARGRTLPGLHARSGRSGQFSIDMGSRLTPAGATIITAGGRVGGKAMAGRLRAHMVPGLSHAVVNLTPATTVAVAWHAKHPRTSWHRAHVKARYGLSIPRGHDIEAGMRLGLTGIDHGRLHRRAQAVGYDTWAAKVVRRIDAGRPLPLFAGNTRSAGTAADLTWQLVQAAASNCGSSSIPGVGYLASAVIDLGILQKQCNTGWSEVLSDLTAINQTLSAMSTQIVDINNDIAQLNQLVRTLTFSISNQAVINDIKTPILNSSQSYEFMAQEAAEASTALGVDLPTILTALNPSTPADDTVTNIRTNGYVQSMQQNASALLDPGSSLNNTLRSAITNLQTAGFVMDGGPEELGILHMMWQATQSPLMTGNQLASFNAYVDSFRRANAQAAAMQVDWLRYEGNASTQIAQYLDDWNPSDQAFASLLTQPLPCAPASTDTLQAVLDQFCAGNYTVTMPGFIDMRTPASGATLPDANVALPVLDPQSGLLWSLACAGVRGGMSLSACPATGFMSTSVTTELAQPVNGVSEGWYWFETPLSSAWSTSTSPVTTNIARPTASQLATLRSLAQDNGQTASTTATWLSSQSPVFADAGRLPTPVADTIGYDCGWVDMFQGSNSSFICGSSAWCNEYAGGAAEATCNQGRLSYAGLLDVQWLGTGEVLDARLGWALFDDPINNAWNCYVSGSDCPRPPDNNFWYVSIFGCTCGSGAYNETVPPSNDEYPMTPYGLPLAVGAVDASAYQPSSSAFVLQTS
jgi:hypothetical protein